MLWVIGLIDEIDDLDFRIFWLVVGKLKDVVGKELVF